jgi:predicted transglutaminase-like cysteine proteinase
MFFMKTATKLLLLGAALAALMLPGMAQTATSTPTTETSPAAPAKKPTIAQRKHHQQARIAQGVKSGQLTAGEASKLETKEAKLNQETHKMREANGGKLTAADKAKVNHQQNKLSRQIYRKKHNAVTQ